MHNFIQPHKCSSHKLCASSECCLLQTPTLLPFRFTLKYFSECANSRITYHLSDSTAIIGQRLFKQTVVTIYSPSTCWSPQEFIAAGAVNVHCELKCPHRPSPTCWMTGSPLDFLPRQTCSCFQAPAVSFALYKPPLCLQSVE